MNDRNSNKTNFLHHSNGSTNTHTHTRNNDENKNQRKTSMYESSRDAKSIAKPMRSERKRVWDETAVNLMEDNIFQFSQDGLYCYYHFDFFSSVSRWICYVYTCWVLGVFPSNRVLIHTIQMMTHLFLPINLLCLDLLLDVIYQHSIPAKTHETTYLMSFG